MDLNHALNENRPIPGDKQRKLIFLHNNVQSHIARPVKNTLKEIQ